MVLIMRFIVASVFFLFVCPSFASLKLVTLDSVDKVVSGFAVEKSDLEAKSTVPVLLPQRVPNGKKLVAHSEVTDGGYHFYFDFHKECKGTTVCNVGEVTAKSAEEPVIHFNRSNKQITLPIKFHKGIKAFFTPSYTMADYHPATLEFRKGPVLYSVKWRIDRADEKLSMIALANTLFSQSFSLK